MRRLYRDDGLAWYDKLPGPQAERTKKDITKLFKKHRLSITIDMNMKQANFLDVTMNLEKDRYWPYKKENNTTTYIHIKSNHPNTITQQLPRMIQTVSPPSQALKKSSTASNANTTMLYREAAMKEVLNMKNSQIKNK